SRRRITFSIRPNAGGGAGSGVAGSLGAGLRWTVATISMDATQRASATTAAAASITQTAVGTAPVSPPQAATTPSTTQTGTDPASPRQTTRAPTRTTAMTRCQTRRRNRGAGSSCGHLPSAAGASRRELDLPAAFPLVCPGDHLLPAPPIELIGEVGLALQLANDLNPRDRDRSHQPSLGRLVA